MRIVCIGGGPAGLYLGLLMKRRHPDHVVTVVERNTLVLNDVWLGLSADATL